jgi:hypothetical protein
MTIIDPKFKSLEAVVGKTISSVDAYNDSGHPSICLRFTDGTSISFLNDSIPRLDIAYYLGEKDDEVVLEQIKGRED